VEFELDWYRVDEGDAIEIDIKPSQREFELVDVLEAEREGWDSVTFGGTLYLPETTVDAVFPEDERESPPATLYVTRRCHETIFRDRTVVSEDSTAAGEYDFEFDVHREQLRGKVEFRPYLVRTEDRPGDEGYATDKNSRVASGVTYTVVIDEHQARGSQSIDGEHASFSKSSHLPEGEKLYYLDFRNEASPKLWVNSDHPRINEVLQSRGSVGAEARMRDVILDQMSYGVWAQLLIRAGSTIDEEGEVEHDWQRAVIETFARNMYDVSDLDEAKRRLRRDIHDPQSLPHLMRRLDTELQEYIDPRAQLINLMEEGLKI
jgi:hypothetical protein